TEPVEGRLRCAQSPEALPAWLSTAGIAREVKAPWASRAGCVTDWVDSVVKVHCGKRDAATHYSHCLLVELPSTGAREPTVVPALRAHVEPPVQVQPRLCGKPCATIAAFIRPRARIEVIDA